MSSKLRNILILGALLLVGCGYDRHTPPADLFADDLPNATVETLRYYADEGLEVAEELCFGGIVTADDKSGNFYRVIVVEDDSGAVEIRLGLYDLWALYPIGCKVVVEAQGLAIAYYNETLVLGRTIYDWSDGRVEPIEPRDEIVERVRVVTSGEPQQPDTFAIGELTEEMCGKLVRVEGVRYVGEPAMGWGTTEYGSEVDREFVDSDGEVILVRTSKYADFAERKVPTERVNICGILYRDRYKGADVFVLKMRNLDDVEVVR